ncbi:MAG: polysaccharide export protein [Hyphomicrobium sp.]|nr:polysaccharide export protein [Hyphomicrobium sp.]
MSLRIASLLAAAAVLMGGCAQSHLAQMSEDLSGLGKLDAVSVLPVDVIYDKPDAATTDPAQPVKAAAWGEAVVQQGASDKVTGWGDTTVDQVLPLKGSDTGIDTGTNTAAPAPLKVADGWHTDASRIVSPVPVGPPPAPVAWGPAVVVTAGPSGGPTGFEPYILDTGDRLRVFVYGQPNLSRLYTVDQVGNIAIPLIGSVRARGRTTVDLERTIAARLGREFVKDPQVTVDVAQNRPFFILGEVRLPGQYPFISGMTVEQAVAVGGGYTERASKRSYRITRKLGALIDQIEAPADYPLCPGDTVYVFERWF